MLNKIIVALATLLFALVICLAWVAFHYYGKAADQAGTITTLTQQKNEAEFISQSQALTFGIFNTIAGATLDKQKANKAASQERQVIIKTVLKTEPCAVVPVPAAAAGSLLDHYNAIRKGASNADTGQSVKPVPNITTAR